jgi:hypothetical protein
VPSTGIKGLPPTMQFEFQLPLNFAIGTYTIRAGFISTLYATTIYSDPMALTVNKIAPGSLVSILGNFMDHPFWPAGQSYTMVPSLDMTYDQQSISDWRTGTYTLTFTGPQNVTYTDIALDSSGDIPFTFPSIKGDYQFKLTFNGTSEVNAVSELGTIKITYAKAVTIALYSTPTTTTEGTKMLYYVVVTGVAGYPRPTGQIELQEGNYVSNLISLGSNGTVSVSITWINVTGSRLGVEYYGDYNYAGGGAAFSLTNPAIPTNSGTGGTGGTGSSGGTSPTASPSANATPSNTPTVAPTNETL